MSKRKKRGGRVPPSLHDLPQAPPNTVKHDDLLLREFGVPPHMLEAVAYAQVTYLAIALVQAAGGSVVLPEDWRERAGMTPERLSRIGTGKHHPDDLSLATRWRPEEDGGGYEVKVARVADMLPDPRRN